jgi:phosphoesterase RecJ-like protein
VPEHLKFLDPERRVTKIGQGTAPEQAIDTDVHIVLDTSAWNQLQDVTPVFKGTSATKVVIDHHVSADQLGAIEFKDVQAEATGALVVRLAEALDWAIPERAVMPLYCAIATDTGWFRFPSTTGDTMRIIGRLIELGAQPHRIYQLLYEQFSPGRVRLAGRVLARLVLDCGDRLAYITATQDDFKSTGAKQADTEDLVNECLRIVGTECAFIAIEQMNGTKSASAAARTSTCPASPNSSAAAATARRRALSCPARWPRRSRKCWRHSGPRWSRSPREPAGQSYGQPWRSLNAIPVRPRRERVSPQREQGAEDSPDASLRGGLKFARAQTASIAARSTISAASSPPLPAPRRSSETPPRSRPGPTGRPVAAGPPARRASPSSRWSAGRPGPAARPSPLRHARCG